jgi:hypothetical protein
LPSLKLQNFKLVEMKPKFCSQLSKSLTAKVKLNKVHHN